MNSGFLAVPPHKNFRALLACVLLAGTIPALTQPAWAQVQPGAPSSGLINPRAIVYSPASGKVYAVDTSHDAVQIYNDASGATRRVGVGAAPVSIAVNAINGRVYVANAGDGTVSVLDGASDALLATVAIGSHPYSIAANAASGKVYVTHTFGEQLSILDGATNAVTDLKTGSADLIAINPRKATVYLLGYGGAVTVLDEVTQKMNIRHVGKHAWGLTLDEAANTVYVARIESADLAAVKDESSEPAILHTGAIPCAIALNSKTHSIYVANYGDNTVTVIDGRNGRTRATVPVGDRPEAIALDPNRNLVYVANTSGDSVTVIDAGDNTVLATLPAGKSPYALAVVPGSDRLYVANEVDDGSSTVVALGGIRKTVP